MQTSTSLSLTLTLAMLVGCRQIPPCQDCEDDAAEDDASMPDLPAPPDLPCGGADLLTDNLNCGTCGHECGVYYLDTPLEAGTCVDGICGPGWSTCVSEGTNGFMDCADVCGVFGYSCVPNGCAGHTGALFEIVGIDDTCDPVWGQPDAVIDGGCDAPIPWTGTSGYPRDVMCCCDVQ